jgi:plastocyanin
MTGATGAKDADVSVSLNKYLFDPSTVKVGDGDVVAVRNGNARTPHTFTVVRGGRRPRARAADDRDGDDRPASGTYQLICRFHESLDRTATLKVS